MKMYDITSCNLDLHNASHNVGNELKIYISYYSLQVLIRLCSLPARSSTISIFHPMSLISLQSHGRSISICKVMSREQSSLYSQEQKVISVSDSSFI